MMLGPAVNRPDRNKAFQFAVPLLSTDEAIFYKRPAVEPDIFGFLKPFHFYASIINSYFYIITKNVINFVNNIFNLCLHACKI